MKTVLILLLYVKRIAPDVLDEFRFHITLTASFESPQ